MSSVRMTTQPPWHGPHNFALSASKLPTSVPLSDRAAGQESSVFRPDDGEAAEEGLQRLGHVHAAVGLLEVLQDGHYEARHRRRRRVERVHVLCRHLRQRKRR